MNKAPHFSLPDQFGAIRTLSDFAGRWLILYSYPQDDTPGCTREACEFRDDYDVLQEAGVEVVGVSKDSVASHAKFAEKYHLTFTLLADESTKVMEAYGAWGPKKFMGREYVGAIRKTVLINPEGMIAKEYPKVTPAGHSKKVLEDWAKLAGRA